MNISLECLNLANLSHVSSEVRLLLSKKNFIGLKKILERNPDVVNEDPSLIYDSLDAVQRTHPQDVQPLINLLRYAKNESLGSKHPEHKRTVFQLALTDRRLTDENTYKLINYLIGRSKHLLGMRDDQNNSCLHFAAMGKRQLKIFQCLLNNGADKNSINNQFKRPIELLTGESPGIENILRGNFQKKKTDIAREAVGEMTNQIWRNENAFENSNHQKMNPIHLAKPHSSRKLRSPFFLTDTNAEQNHGRNSVSESILHEGEREIDEMTEMSDLTVAYEALSQEHHDLKSEYLKERQVREEIMRHDLKKEEELKTLKRIILSQENVRKDKGCFVTGNPSIVWSLGRFRSVNLKTFKSVSGS